MIETLQAYLSELRPGAVSGLYLFGSSVAGGLRPESDIDLLMLTERSLSQRERHGLVELLLQHSGARATVAPGRAVEVTSVVLDDVVPWAYPPVCDFQYGEWLRDDFVDGRVPERHVNPDLAVLITMVLQQAKAVYGPKLDEVLEPVPTDDLYRSMRDSIAPLLSDLVGDERNVLLTLARMVVTFDTGEIASKDEAARHLLPDLPEPYRSVMSLAVDGYLGERRDDWSRRRPQVEDTADYLARRLRK